MNIKIKQDVNLTCEVDSLMEAEVIKGLSTPSVQIGLTSGFSYVHIFSFQVSLHPI